LRERDTLQLESGGAWQGLEDAYLDDPFKCHMTGHRDVKRLGLDDGQKVCCTRGILKVHSVSRRKCGLTAGGSAARADRHRTMNVRHGPTAATVQRASAAAAG
jgi:hypothetical protein